VIKDFLSKMHSAMNYGKAGSPAANFYKI